MTFWGWSPAFGSFYWSRCALAVPIVHGEKWFFWQFSSSRLAQTHTSWMSATHSLLRLTFPSYMPGIWKPPTWYQGVNDTSVLTLSTVLSTFHVTAHLTCTRGPLEMRHSHPHVWQEKQLRLRCWYSLNFVSGKFKLQHFAVCPRGLCSQTSLYQGQCVPQCKQPASSLDQLCLLIQVYYDQARSLWTSLMKSKEW